MTKIENEEVDRPGQEASESSVSADFPDFVISVGLATFYISGIKSLVVDRPRRHVR